MRRPRGELGFLMTAVLCIGLLIGEGISGRFEARASDIYEQLEVLTEALGIVEDEYVEPVETSTLVNGALRGMMRELDQYSQFMDPDMYEELNTETRGHFGGLGIVIGQDDNEVLTVMSPIAGTPAANAGILPGDKIIKIEGEATSGMTLIEAVKLLRGPRGSKVTITILRLNELEGGMVEPEEFDVTLTRAVIEIPSEKGEMLDDGIAAVRIIEFKESTARDLKEDLERLQAEGMRGLVLDLRNNPGGLLQAAAQVSDIFLDKGEAIVRTESRDASQNMHFSATSDALVGHDVPMVILLNQGSASASEIVAGALKDHGRAAVMGEKSFGKASVQSIIPLSSGNGAALRLTTARYLTPSGLSINGTGIPPDVEIKATRELLAQLMRDGARVSTPGVPVVPEGEEPPERVEDVQMAQALDFLRNYDATLDLAANLAQLRERGLLIAAAPADATADPHAVVEN